MKQLKENECVTTLGVLVNPSLNWDDEHECVKNKLTMAIKKTMRTEIIMWQIHMHFNRCMLKMCILVVT